MRVVDHCAANDAYWMRNEVKPKQGRKSRKRNKNETAAEVLSKAVLTRLMVSGGCFVSLKNGLTDEVYVEAKEWRRVESRGGLVDG